MRCVGCVLYQKWLKLSSTVDKFKPLLMGTLPAAQTCGLRAIKEQLRWFAGPQVRNVSSIGGNVCTGSPISDINPLWIASGAVFTVESLDRGARDVPAGRGLHSSTFELNLSHFRQNIHPAHPLLPPDTS